MAEPAEGPVEQAEERGDVARAAATPASRAPKLPKPETVATSADLTRMRRSWWISSEAFVEMLAQMRKSFVNGKDYMAKMWKLISDPPKGEKPFTGGDHLVFDDFAAGLLYDFQDAVQPKLAQDTKALLQLLQRLEGFIASETRAMRPEDDWTLQPEVFGKASWQAARQAQVAFPGRARASTSLPLGGFAGQRHLLFVGLPLALYCSDCPHLYQVLRRMRSLALRDAPTPSRLREGLDHDGRPYSVLVYALMAALQALGALRRCGIALEPLAPKGGALIFRGLWVPGEVDEHWAAHSWSFNSFSRSVEGVLSVLGFYGNATGSEAEALARSDGHILLLVARMDQWAFPVQLYAGGENAFPASIEQEVLVPPFCKYLFLPNSELSSSETCAERLPKIQFVEERWTLSLAQEAPRLLELLEPGGLVHQKGFLHLKDHIRVTVRFIQEIEPVCHLRELFRAPSVACSSAQRYRLLQFPAK